MSEKTMSDVAKAFQQTGELIGHTSVYIAVRIVIEDNLQKATDGEITAKEAFALIVEAMVAHSEEFDKKVIEND